MTESVTQEVQKSEKDPYVELWQLDLALLGGPVLYFTSNVYPDGSNLIFGGNTYSQFDIQGEGFEWNGQGALPTPRVRFSTTNVYITSFISSYSDLCGATLTRIRTYQKFLDGQSSANSAEYFSKDIYRVNVKTTENKVYAEFELTSAMDQQGIMLPRGQIVPYCRAIYRKWNGTSFTTNPSDLACPYTGTNYFDKNDASTTQANDQCSHLITGCKARYTGSTTEIPFMGFPGTQRPVVG